MILLYRLVRSRRHLSLPELNEYPLVDAGAEQPVSAYTPRFTKTKNVTRRRLVELAAPPVYPQAAVVDVRLEGGGPPFVIRTVRSRKLQKIPSLVEAPLPSVDPSVYPDRIWPPTFSREFRIRRRDLGIAALLTVTDVAPVSADYPSFLERPRHRVAFSIHRQDLAELNEYPQEVPPAEQPISALVQVFRKRRKPPRITLELLGVILADQNPGPIAVDSLHVPAIRALRRTRFVLRHLPALDEYPEVAAEDEQPVTAFQLPPTHRRAYQITLRTLAPPVDLPEVEVDTPLASFRQVTLKQKKTARRLQVAIPLGDYGDPFVPPVEPYPSFLAPVSFRRHGRFSLRLLGQFDEWPVAVPTGALGFAGRAPIHDHNVHVSGSITDTIYLQGDIQPEALLLTWLGDKTLHLQGDISEVIYLQTEFNFKDD